MLPPRARPFHPCMSQNRCFLSRRPAPQLLVYRRSGSILASPVANRLSSTPTSSATDTATRKEQKASHPRTCTECVRQRLHMHPDRCGRSARQRRECRPPTRKELAPQEDRAGSKASENSQRQAPPSVVPQQLARDGMRGQTDGMRGPTDGMWGPTMQPMKRLGLSPSPSPSPHPFPAPLFASRLSAPTPARSTCPASTRGRPRASTGCGGWRTERGGRWKSAPYLSSTWKWPGCTRSGKQRPRLEP